MHEIIDLEHYPLDRIDCPKGRELVERCRNDLARDGMFNLVGLMLPEAIEKSGRADYFTVSIRSVYTSSQAQHIFSARSSGSSRRSPGIATI